MSVPAGHIDRSYHAAIISNCQKTEEAINKAGIVSGDLTFSIHSRATLQGVWQCCGRCEELWWAGIRGYWLLRYLSLETKMEFAGAKILEKSTRYIFRIKCGLT